MSTIVTQIRNSSEHEERSEASYLPTLRFIIRTLNPILYVVRGAEPTGRQVVATVDAVYDHPESVVRDVPVAALTRETAVVAAAHARIRCFVPRRVCSQNHSMSCTQCYTRALAR